MAEYPLSFSRPTEAERAAVSSGLRRRHTKELLQWIKVGIRQGVSFNE
jgi:hypothetical protein